MAIPLRSRDRRPETSSTASSPPVPSSPTAAPRLQVLEGTRRAAWFAVTLSVLIAGVMLGALALHTRIAERQLQIDQLERSVRRAQTDYDVLRAERAELRSPTRLAERAGELGMSAGRESAFVTVDPMLYARVIASTGEIPVADSIGVGSNTRLDPLDQFRVVKSASAEVP